jgi:hypothetical protein
MMDEIIEHGFLNIENPKILLSGKCMIGVKFRNIHRNHISKFCIKQDLEKRNPIRKILFFISYFKKCHESFK